VHVTETSSYGEIGAYCGELLVDGVDILGLFVVSANSCGEYVEGFQRCVRCQQGKAVVGFTWV